MPKVVIYLRVSTGKQMASSLGIEAQRAAVTRFVEAEGLEVVQEFVEAESGKGSIDTLDRRPVLKETLALAKLHKCPVLVSKLCRLSRDVNFISSLMTQKVSFIVGDLGMNCDPFLLHLYAALGEKERNMISERTKSALKAAKDRGQTLGGFRGHKIDVDATKKGIEVRQSNAAEHRSAMLPIVKELQKSGCDTLQKVADALNAKGLTARRGGQWSSGQVHMLLRSAEK